MMPGAPEMLIILVLVLVLFGAGRPPEVFKALGQGVKSFRDAQNEDPEAPTRELEDKNPVASATEVPAQNAKS